MAFNAMFGKVVRCASEEVVKLLRSRILSA